MFHVKHNKNILTFIENAVDLILPPRCPITGDLVDRQGVISPKAWAKLDFITKPFCKTCGIPFGFEGDIDDAGESMCTKCLDKPPIFKSARSALIYNDTSRDLILGFKHGDKTHIAPSFVPWLTRAGSQMLENADYLIPVPLHRLRLISRRYNQAAIIAQALSRRTQIPHLPLALTRIRATQSQGHLKPDERARNVRKAFALNPKFKETLKGKSVILIDDVFTTGATVQECTKVLLKEGAKQVHILTLARVIKN